MKRFAAGFLILAVLAFFFQNCGKAGFENSELSSLSDEVQVDPKLKNLPFPYQVSVNQIAHMSCPMSPANSGAQSPYFSWKVGAFDNPMDVPSASMNIRPAGLQLTTHFQTEWKKVASTLNPTIHKQKFLEFISEHPAVAGHALQLSFRSVTNPATILMTMPSGSPSPTSLLRVPVSAPAIGESFVDIPPGPLNVFANVPDFSSRFLQMSLTIPSTYGVPDQMLRANYDSSYMALAFVKTSDEKGIALASSSADGRYAFGKGYRVRFNKANPHVGTTFYPPADSLGAIEEQDLETGYATPGVGWDCSYKLKIVRPADRYNTMYRRDNFVKPGGNCPTPALGPVDYCASPIDNSFGLDARLFPNGQCPSNRPRINGMYCNEKYMLTCPPEPYAGSTTNPNILEREDGIYHPRYPQRPAILHALRRFLPANQWDINVSRGCIVPKFDDNTCYQNPPIVYDEYFFAGTSANPTMGQYAGCGVNGQYQCASYLTLCVRR